MKRYAARNINGQQILLPGCLDLAFGCFGLYRMLNAGHYHGGDHAKEQSLYLYATVRAATS
jgi:hypothetical protein